MSPLKSLTVVFLTAISVRVISTHDCQVLVGVPWPVPYLFVPRESTVEINCTARDGSYSPFWLIDLSNDTKDFPLRFTDQQELLNAHGVYQLPQIETPGMPTTVRLLINDTQRNNQTDIHCDQSETTGSTTTLFVLDPIILLSGNAVDMGVNLSWIRSRESQSLDDAALRFSLKISDGSSIQLFNESTYYFTAPEGASHCQVYNFSIITTYVVDAGAAYTGAGCSVPSPVLSITLPSLPSISLLESSLNFVLSKKSAAAGFSLQIFFKPASYCEAYPVVNYTMIVMNSLIDETVESVSATHADSFTLAGNLSDNADYYFKILVANSVGIVSTNDTHFYTTDVQGVIATLIEGTNASTIRCEFITGSDATGCMVMLISENNGKEYQHNLIRGNQSVAVLSVTLEHSPSCYTGVEAFDIESDGSVGSLAVSGQLRVDSQVPCTPPLPVAPGPSGSVLTTWAIAAVIIAIALVILSAIITLVTIIIMIIVHKAKISQGTSTGNATLERGRETACCHNNIMSINILSDEAVKGENIYSEISPTSSQPGGDAAAMDRKPENTYTEDLVRNSIREPAKGANPGEPETLKETAAGIPLEEMLYEQPWAAMERSPGDGAEYSRTCHHNLLLLAPVSALSRCEDDHYSKLAQNKDHIYFTLEPDRAPRGVTSPGASSYPQTTIISDDASAAATQKSNCNTSPPPIYQEITELSTSRGVVAAVLATHQEIRSTNTTLVSSTLPHIQRSHSIPIADSEITQTPNQWGLNHDANIGTMV